MQMETDKNLTHYFHHIRTRLKSAPKMFFFHDQFCWQCADGGARQVSLASPNKVRGEAIYYFGGEPSWRNLEGSRWWSDDSNRLDRQIFSHSVALLHIDGMILFQN